MTDLPTEFTEQLRRVRATSEQIAGIVPLLDDVSNQLRRSGSAAEANVDVLRQSARAAVDALDNLVTATGFLEQLRRTGEPTVKTLTAAMDELVLVSGQARENVTALQLSSSRIQDELSSSAVRLQATLDHVPTVFGGVNSRIADLSADIEQLQRVLASVTAELEHGPRAAERTLAGLRYRINLLAPAVVVGMSLVFLFTDASLAEAIAWAALSFGIAVAGVSMERVVDAAKSIKERLSPNAPEK